MANVFDRGRGRHLGVLADRVRHLGLGDRLVGAVALLIAAFLVVLALRLRRETGSDHVDAGGDAP